MTLVTMSLALGSPTLGTRQHCNHLTRYFLFTLLNQACNASPKSKHHVNANSLVSTNLE